MTELSVNWRKLQPTLQSSMTVKTSSSKRKLEDSRLDGLGKSANKRPCKKSFKMGSAHSTKVAGEISKRQIPSLQLLTKCNDISSESLAEAYELGLRENHFSITSQNDIANHGLSSKINVGKYIAVDCEMVGVGYGGYTSALARVSLVDFYGRQIYDSYVKPTERVTDWRSSVSGVSPKEMRFARDFDEVQSEVARILEGRVLIGHDVKHDLEALKLTHPTKDIRDTAKHKAFRKFGNGQKPALRTLAQELLGIHIQQGSHSSTEDARATMFLFRKEKSSFDVEHANRYHLNVPISRKGRSKRHTKKALIQKPSFSETKAR